MEKYLELLFQLGIKHNAILDVWRDQSIHGKENHLFGLYFFQSDYSSPMKLFLNLNFEYMIIQKFGIGNQWRLIKKGIYKVEDQKIFLNIKRYDFHKMNEMTIEKLESDEKITTVLKTPETEIKNSGKWDKLFIKEEFPKVVFCLQNTLSKNIFSNSLTIGNKYVATSLTNGKIRVLNDNGKFGNYPKELFENL